MKGKTVFATIHHTPIVFDGKGAVALLFDEDGLNLMISRLTNLRDDEYGKAGEEKKENTKTP